MRVRRNGRPAALQPHLEDPSMTNRIDTHAVAADVRPLWGFNGETLDYAERAYRSWLQGAESVQANAMSYWSTEMQKGIEAMNEIAKCQSAAEAFGIQTRYATEAMQDFFAESQKVMDQLTTLGATPWTTTPPPMAEEKREAEATHKRATHHRRG
jgi:hypothetical protein